MRDVAADKRAPAVGLESEPPASTEVVDLTATNSPRIIQWTVKNHDGEYKTQRAAVIGGGQLANALENALVSHYSSRMDAASALKAATEILSTVFPAADVRRALGDLEANAARENTHRAKGQPRAVEHAAVEVGKLVAAVMVDKTLGRLRERYEERLASIELPPDGFKTVEQARAAARLATTYDNLRTRQIERGLKPEPQDRRVVKANSLKIAFYREQRKARAKAEP